MGNKINEPYVGELVKKKQRERFEEDLNHAIKLYKNSGKITKELFDICSIFEDKYKNTHLDCDDIYVKMMDLYDMVANKEIPEKIPSEFTNQYSSFSFSILREHFIKIQGYPFVTKDWIKELSKLLRGKKVLEVMCGLGTISYALKNEGIDIIATDDISWKETWKNAYNHYCEIEELDAIEAIDKYGKDIDYIIMSWPPYEDPIAYKVLQKMREVNKDAAIIYLGEGYGGCTADNLFHYRVNIIENDIIDNVNSIYKPWPTIHDSFSLVK